ncbi:MAG: hypothetical protein WAK93_15160 [Solirubrobacteraceae bacterium]
MADDPVLIIQVPQGSAVERQLTEGGLDALAGGDVLVQRAPTDAQGNLEAIAVGEVVLSVPSPETLERQADEIRQVVGHAGTGTQPLVVIVEAAEEFRDVDLAPLVEASRRTSRAVILRVIREA